MCEAAGTLEGSSRIAVAETSLSGRPARRQVLAGLICAGAVFAVRPDSALARDGYAPRTMIWDPQSRRWVAYTPARARQFYQLRGTIPEKMRRTVVPFRAPEKPGTIVVDADRHFLYVVLPGGQAMRYGVGVGRDGFGWAGIVKVGRKTKWPRWTPPADMVKRDPEAAKWASGMPGGPDNPLGARALYLYQGGRDTIYRIHGTSEPWSIGLNVSSGCIRLLNEDIEDVYNRVPVGAKVIVLSQDASQFEGAL
ncbi:MAG: L,D-transpeptidase [Hyphomicrobiales bacterium]|nr:L,D-transpeptidase [Hyphomicrobiales bacterium]